MLTLLTLRRALSELRSDFRLEGVVFVFAGENGANAARRSRW
jgi:hypothetical protein